MRRDPDSWEGSIVRGRDGRKGRVLGDARPLFGGRSTLTVHWETNTIEEADRQEVTMLRPPLGFRLPEERERLPWLDRLPFPWWTEAAAGLLLLTAAVAVWFISTGGR